MEKSRWPARILQSGKILNGTVQALTNRAEARKAPLETLKELFAVQYGPSQDAITDAVNRRAELVRNATKSIVGESAPLVIGEDSKHDLIHIEVDILQKLHGYLTESKAAILDGRVINATAIDSRLGDVNSALLSIQNGGSQGLASDDLDRYLDGIQSLISAKKTIESIGV